MTIALLLLAAIPNAAPAAPVLDFTDSAQTVAAVATTFGWSFSVANSLHVEALGIWDEGGNGLVLSHGVALWDNNGVLLAQTTVDNNSVPVASTSTAGRWMFTSIAPMNLPAGIYVVGAYYPNILDTFRQNASWTTEPGVIHLNRRNANPINDLAFPANSFAAGGYFGPNLSTTPVPEPAAGAIALATGCTLIGRRRRRGAHRPELA